MLFLTRQDIDERRARGYEEANLYSSPSKERVVRANQIITDTAEAFKDVHLGAGIGLFEAQAIDDYETDSERGRMRAKDEKDDWQQIEVKHLNACQSSLSFFDPAGMRFHLPAYICCDLAGNSTMHLEFYLTELADWQQNQFTLLTQPEKNAVSTSLEFLAEDIDAEFSRKAINTSLNEFWRNHH